MTNKEINKNKAVFLDRDGTIVEDYGYITIWNKDLLIPNSIEAIKLLNDNHYKVIVVTNQAGIAHGFITEEDVILFNKQMKEEIEWQGAKIDAFYYCPFHNNGKIEKYKKDADCRKPNPGMLKRAEKEFNIDLSQSWIIGDQKTDIDAGNSVGCRSILVLTGHGNRELENDDNDINFDHLSDNLYDAVNKVILNIKEKHG